MPSDYDLSDDENEYYDDEDDDMFDGTQEEGKPISFPVPVSALCTPPC